MMISRLFFWGAYRLFSRPRVQLRASHSRLLLPPVFYASSLYWLVCWGGATNCQASNTFGTFGGNLETRDGQPEAFTSLGFVESVANDANGMSAASLTTARPNGNVFTFDAAATSDSSTGSAEVISNLSFHQSFDVIQPMRVILTAAVLSPDDDFGVFAAIFVNDGNQATPLSIISDTGGTPDQVSLIFQPVDFDNMDPIIVPPIMPHSISGFINTNAGAAGTHTGSIQGAVTITLPGDLSGDLVVDEADLEFWENGFGLQEVTFINGDIDGNRRVDGADFLLWQRQSGLVATSTITVARAVPEPTAACLMLFAACCGGLKRCRNAFC